MRIPVSDRMPKNLVVVLLDSLNRHMLEAYGHDEFATPNITRFSQDSLRFTRHHVGSLPCMPARHDILVGALDFPWRPWGSIEALSLIHIWPSCLLELSELIPSPSVAILARTEREMTYARNAWRGGLPLRKFARTAS